MLIQLNQKQTKLQNELQEYFESIITPELKKRAQSARAFRRWWA
ncbi:hypothetical protein OAM41_02050 [Gammaproteobacteria bacterium]|nr:hypothetical protein [Gammaproteobacteria bacterium]